VILHHCPVLPNLVGCVRARRRRVQLRFSSGVATGWLVGDHGGAVATTGTMRSALRRSRRP